MLSLLDPPAPLADRVSRREWLRVGGLSALGVSLADVLHAGQSPAQPADTPRLAGDLGATFGRAKNVIYLWLQGGPPQHETFDPKPDAPVDIRGPFKPIATNVPGIRFCELLPRTARYADRLAVVRSLSTRDDNHDVSGYWLLTGYPYGPGSARQIKPSDWPYFGSIVKMLKPSQKLPALTSVWIPDVMRLNDNVTPAGQTAGFLGKMWEPERFVGDPATPDYHIEGLGLAGDITRVRVDRRRDLLAQLDRSFDARGRGESVEAWDRLSHHAFDLVTSGAARAAFDLGKESDRTRDRYGRHTWGQSCLLARRLVEAGVRLVHVNWARDPGDSAVDNPLWDTHAQNADRLQDSLCPQFDVSFAALMDDLTDRGLLDETLVVVIGEFGRTPRINKQGGRDHWGHVFSFALAGAGIRGGQVIGASDRNGAYPATDPIRGGDLTATLFHLLGIDPNGMFLDRANRPHPITKGEPIAAALGNTPATSERCKPGGDPAFVPPFDASLLLDTAFGPGFPLVPPSPPMREKGWRAIPIWDAKTTGFAVRKEATGVVMGYGLEDAKAGAAIDAGARVILAQEVRNARGGHYTFAVKLAGESSSAAGFQTFLAHFACRLVLFRFRDTNKDPRAVDELAAAEFRPAFGKTETFRVDRFLGSTVPGANFPIGNGLGVALIVARKTAGALPVGELHRAGLRVHSATLDFSPRQRDESVVEQSLLAEAAVRPRAALLTVPLVAALPLLLAGEPDGGFAPAEAVKRARPAGGLTVKLFAAEPDVRQPIFVKCDDRGRVWTIQYLQYPNPAGLKRVKVDRWSRTVYDRVPEPPPRGPKSADRITICEDSDGDGRADTFQDFVAGLNLCTGVEFGHGGVFVLQAPYLLFYPDRDRDDVPDREPDVLLTGFGMEDAQSLANHLTWGPDGWLYGLNGSTTTCRIRGIEFQQGVWRYHPVSKEFELFCEGGGNVYGLTFDDDGNLFYSSNLGLFWHAHQGAYYLKNVGKHGPLHNPHAHGWLSHVAHDVPTGGPTTGGTIYRGDSFPDRFRGRFLAGDFLRHTASSWELKRSGATVTATFRELLLDSRDPWFGATDLCLAPDGSVYLSDFYDRRTAHPDPDADWDRSNGRIYKIEAAGTKPLAKFDLAKLPAQELVALLKHPNGWYSDRARLLLAKRRDRSVWPALRDLATQQKDARLALKGLWALHASGGFDEKLAAELLRHPAEYVRAWTVRLLGDAKKVSAPLAKQFAELAAKDTGPAVLAQLLGTAKRLPGELALPVIEAILLRGMDANDPVIPWLLWWAVERHAMPSRERLTAFFAAAENRKSQAVRANLGRLVRRYAAEGTGAAYDAAHTLLTSATPAERRPLLEAFDRGLAERAVGLPPVGQGGLFDALAPPGTERPKSRKYEELTDRVETLIKAEWLAAKTDELATRLALRAGLGEARDRVHQDIADTKTPRALLLQRLAVLEELGTAAGVTVVLPHLAAPDAEVQKRALAVLARVGDAGAGEAIVQHYAALPTALRPRAREVLFGRVEWARAFLALVDAKKVPPAEVPVEQVRLLALLGDKEIDAAVRRHWGNVKPGTPEEKLAEMRRFSNDLRAGTGDATRGKALFAKHCGACHKLFGEGGTIGPDITNTSRADTAWLLASVVDPEAVVKAQYVPVAVRTTAEVVFTGLVAEQDGASLTLVDARGQRTRIPRDRIDAVRELPTSIMPEKLLDSLSPQERRDLFRYLQQPAPK